MYSFIQQKPIPMFTKFISYLLVYGIFTKQKTLIHSLTMTYVYFQSCILAIKTKVFCDRQSSKNRKYVSFQQKRVAWISIWHFTRVCSRLKSPSLLLHSGKLDGQIKTVCPDFSMLKYLSLQLLFHSACVV